MTQRPSIFITGAARGIGKACAEHFAAGGYFVGLYDLAEASLDALSAELSARYGPDCCCHAAMDLRDPASARAALEHFAARTGGHMHVLLNNAGVMPVGSFEALEIDAHRQTIAVNFTAIVELAHASFALLEATPGARMINLSSIAALHGTPEMACYSATKHAVRGLSEALEIEWARHDIRVCDVMPAFVATQLLRDTATLTAERHVGVGLTAEDVAAWVWRAAHARRWRTHWPVGWHSQLAYLVGRRLPVALQRWAVARVSGL